MRTPEIDAELQKVVITDLLPRERLLELWDEFKRDRPDYLERMNSYDGADPDWVQAMRGWVAVFVLGKLEKGEIAIEEGRRATLPHRQVSQANAISSGMIQLGRIVDPKLKWLGWD